MKKLFILFLLVSFNCFADENINFKDYLLKGNFKKEIFREYYVLQFAEKIGIMRLTLPLRQKFSHKHFLEKG